MATKKTPTRNKVPAVTARIDRLVDYEGTNVRAIASANIGGAYTIHGLKVMDSDKGLFVSMPSSKYEKNGQTQYSETFHPISKEAREELNGAVLDAYEQRIHMEEDQSQGLEDQSEDESAAMTQTM